jgi:hypothetical protein
LALLFYLDFQFVDYVDLLLWTLDSAETVDYVFVVDAVHIVDIVDYVDAVGDVDLLIF